jgi:hypothetical protein
LRTHLGFFLLSLRRKIFSSLSFSPLLKFAYFYAFSFTSLLEFARL